MQKDDKSYSFLLSRSYKNRIYIKRVEVSKRHLSFGSIGAFAVLIGVVLAVGLNGIANNPTLVAGISETAVLNSVAAEPTRVKAEMVRSDVAISPQDIASNSGGPDADPATDGENPELDNQLRSIRLNSNPSTLPTMWAHLGKINNEFGFRRNPFGGRAYEFHPGMDIDGERGDIIQAAADGTIVKAGMTGGYGNMVEIDHGNGLTTRYGHMSKIEAHVGDRVTRGQLIGFIGSTGRSTGPHLHFELRLNDHPINPRHFLPQEPTDLADIPK